METSMRSFEGFNFLAIFLGIVILVLVWLSTTVKKIYNRLNKRNNIVPIVGTIKKIIPPHINSGWQVCSVSNSVPIWKYSVTFTFAPKNLYCCRTLLQKNSQVVLKELLDVKIFSSLFPNSRKFQVEKGSLRNQEDVISVLNLDSSLSLTSILLSQHSLLGINRKWFCSQSETWLYIHPSNMLLTKIYGYWMFFHVQDIENNGSIFHLLASYPSSKNFNDISSSMSSSLILLKEHIDSISILKLQVPSEELVVNTSKGYGLSPQANKEHDHSSEINKEYDLSPQTNKEYDHSTQINKEYDHLLKINKKPDHLLHINSDDDHSPHINELDPSMLISKDHNYTQKINRELKVSECITNDLDNTNNIQNLITNHDKDFEEPSISKQLTEQLTPYLDVLHEGFNLLMNVYQADETTPGWNFIGVKDGVRMYKKDKDEISEAPTFKGVGIVKVPLDYVIQYTSSLAFKSEYDKMFESGSVVELFCDNLTKIVNLKYVGIWPVTGRDFCSISALRHLKENLYGVCVKGVKHPDCPPTSSKVRGHVIIGGFLYKEISSDPPEVELTYLARVELGGSIPQTIINKISAEQSFFPAIIRKHCERRFNIQDPVSEGKKLIEDIHLFPSWFEKKIKNPVSVPVIANIEQIEKVASQVENSQTLLNLEYIATSDDTKDFEKQTIDKATDQVELISNLSTNKTDESENLANTLLSDILSNEDHYSCSTDDLQSQISDESFLFETESMKDTSMVTVSDQQLDLPRDRYGQVDFITLGNQTAATLEEEFFLAVKALAVSINSNKLSNTPSNENDNFGWLYQGTKKGVKIMKKIHSKQKFHSFFGRGVIHVLPITVLTAVKNPSTRYIYDNMLKRADIIREISDRHKIVHMLYETNNCFVKQARDFCILHSERVEQSQYVLAATSVEIPECPCVKDCVRGKVLSSGWIIEPIEKNGKSCSLVTYISQVDFGGRLPTRLINYIAKRQPMALAYLRDYLESAEK